MIDPRIQFAPESGENAHFEFEVRYGIKENGSMNYVIYDAFKIEMTFNFEISQEVLLANIVKMTITKASEPVDRTLPIYTDLDITEDQYRDFWSNAEFQLDRWFHYLNEEVFGMGVSLPY